MGWSIIDEERAERNEAWRRATPPPPTDAPEPIDLADNAPSTGYDLNGKHYRGSGA